MTTPGAPADRLETLLAAAGRGDEAAFARLYAETSPRLFAVLMRMLKRTDWAEEALQDCYLRIWRRAESYLAERGSPLAWLTTIARYRALDLLRARRPEVEASPMGEGHADRVDRAAAAPASVPDHAERLDECLGRLSAEQRDSILLAFYEGYTHAELAQRLSTPLGTVKSWVRRGLQQLRACLEGEPA